VVTSFVTYHLGEDSHLSPAKTSQTDLGLAPRTEPLIAR
jgi:hypothetical protein